MAAKGQIKSKALEINLARTQVDVEIDPRYNCLLDVMATYYGLQSGLKVFLKELGHPYRNWQFIVDEARGYALDYFHLLKDHDQGVAAAQRLIEIFNTAIDNGSPASVRIDAVDNLMRFLQKIVTDAGDRYPLFEPLVNVALDQIKGRNRDPFVLFVKTYYPVKRLAELLISRQDDRPRDLHSAIGLLARDLDTAYGYWLGEKDPLQWFAEEATDLASAGNLEAIFAPISHAAMASYRDQLKAIIAKKNADDRKTLSEMIALPGFNDIVRVYRQIPQKLLEAGERRQAGNQWKVLFLFHSMNLEGLAIIHEDTLRDINRTLRWLIRNEQGRYVIDLIGRTFEILKTSVARYPITALSCVLNMGTGIYETDEYDLVKSFTDAVIDLDFQTPMIGGVGDDWQIKVNSAHIQNIRTWLALIKLRPKWSTRLLSNLVIHLAVSGIFIKDTDLFGRDITELLNSDISTVYNLTKQLARLFPAYFNDIGAEGRLRDISTQIDEIEQRRDPLIHFLRKQSHVESSNRILDLMRAAWRFWSTTDKTALKSFLPPNIFAKIETRGPYIDGVHRIAASLVKDGIVEADDLLHFSPEDLSRWASAEKSASEKDGHRIQLFAELYKLLNTKYNLDFLDLRQHLDQLSTEAFPDLDKIKTALDEPELKSRLFKLLDYMETLKSIILNPETFPIREDIYKKRHFTVDIPSMYGSYNEMKFDAMGLTLRLEALANVLFEDLVSTIDLSLITKATVYQIYDRLMLFDKALKIDGITSIEMERQLDLLAHSLEVRGFSFTQYLDIFKGFAQAVKNIINDYFNNVHGEHLTRILHRLPSDRILDKYMPSDASEDADRFSHRISEIFFRDRIAMSLGLQQLDLFLSRILNTLFHQSNKLPKDKLHLLLNYDPQRATTSLDDPNPRATGIIYLGNKGLNLLRIKNFGIPVPPGFIITTEVFRCRDIIDSFGPAEENFTEQVSQHIHHVEQLTGRRFGDPANPLLFSVRSGSSISQPGMMDTFLNVGINEDIAEGLAVRTNNTWFAWDSYRRFMQCFGMSLGLERNDFDAIISDFKQKLGIPLKKGFTGQQMKQVALAYKARILDDGYQVPDDPLRQLHLTLKSVLDSWESSKARTYRKIMGISDDWGTAVTVQSMVYGNISQLSGTGVIFTHNPRWAGESLSLWGDFTLENQGEDVVSGLVQTLPISIRQQEIENRNTDIILETHFPDIYKAMRDWAKLLIFEKGWSPQEMEFTFERPSVEGLYLLQTRDMAIREHRQVLTFNVKEQREAIHLGSGIGVAGGAMSGRLVFSVEEVMHWRRREPDAQLILVRGDTVPDDIKEIHAADGLLTARGGVTSHASVVAHRLGKTCVVGCANMICDERNRTVRFADHQLRSGDHISIDGRQGSVYQGLMKIDAL